GEVLNRLPPGQGCVPFKEFFAAVRAKGYAGFLSYEAPNPAAWSRPPGEVAREALAATRAVLRAASGVRPQKSHLSPWSGGEAGGTGLSACTSSRRGRMPIHSRR